MNHITLVSALIFSIILIPSVNASQNVPIDSVPAGRGEQRLPAYPFSAVVTRDGKITVKPGAVFTEAGDSRGLSLPYLISNPKPISYPRWAVRQGWQGTCEIAIEVLTGGTVGRYKVMHSAGYHVLDHEAVKAVRSWKFYPAMKDGKPVVTCVQIPVFFKLEIE